MRTSTRNVVGAVAVALAVAGCNGGTDSCPTETPDVEGIATDCVVRPGATVSYPIRLCPTCNQFGAVCDAQIDAGQIFLDPRMEACESSTSCPSPAPACEANPLVCTFIAPTIEATYPVTVIDPGGTFSGTLTVSSTLPLSCAL
jgi:hypothetical protein